MHLLIRADASRQQGIGHVMRCLALAQVCLDEGGQATYLTSLSTQPVADRLQIEGVQVHYLADSMVPGSQEDAVYTVELSKVLKAAWVILDGYHFGETYQYWIKQDGLKLLAIDDCGHTQHYWADYIVNPNVYASEILYANKESYTKLLLGCTYSLIRNEFYGYRNWLRNIPTKAKKIFVTLGGSDPNNVTLNVLKGLANIKNQEVEIIVVIGGNNPHYEQLLDFTQNTGLNIVLKCNVSNMAELIAWADIAVTAGGSTCWDMAFLGLPSLIIVLADNQLFVAEKLDALGAAINLGWYSSISLRLITDAVDNLLMSCDLRQTLSNTARQLVDGEGSRRIVWKLRNNYLRLRTANKADDKMLWEWVNDPQVRVSAFSSELISWEKHLAWFTHKLQDPNCFIFIAMDCDDLPVGQVRVDVQATNQAEIDIHLAPGRRGFGYGTCLLIEAVHLIFRETAVELINAYIKPDNIASIKMFEKANFSMKGRNSASYHYVLEGRKVT